MKTFNRNPVQGIFNDKNLSPEELARKRIREFLDEKRIRDAERSAREGMKGYR